jgi:hypothetical protein
VRLKENPRSCMDKIEGKLSDYTLQADTIVPLTDHHISDDRSAECGAFKQTVYLQIE